MYHNDPLFPLVSWTRSIRSSFENHKPFDQVLRDCLPENLFNLCVATAIKTATRLVVLDQQLNQKFARPLSHPTLPDNSGFGVNRLTLREILLADLEDILARLVNGSTR